MDQQTRNNSLEGKHQQIVARLPKAQLSIIQMKL